MAIYLEICCVNILMELEFFTQNMFLEKCLLGVEAI